MKYGIGELSSRCVLAWTGLYGALVDLVCMFVFRSCLQNQFECSGCFAAFLAKFSDSFSLLLSSLSSSVFARAINIAQ